jgi:LCP family protein required for cell wall assembly
VGQEKGDVVLLSVPRDIWVPSLKAKLNSAFHYGEKKRPGGGFTLAKSAVSETINQPIDFVAMINFANFEKVIDSLGGVDINVEKDLDDAKFPIPGKENDECGGDEEYMCRYEHLHFSAGVQHMDGKTALKYVRSRQAEGDEGTDFARSRRQERLLLAIKEKLLSLGVLTDPNKLSSLYKSVSSSIVTDIANDLPAIIKLGLKSAKLNDVKSAAISDPDQLYHPSISPLYNNQWVLAPKGDNPQIIFDFVSGLLGK